MFPRQRASIPDSNPYASPPLDGPELEELAPEVRIRVDFDRFGERSLCCLKVAWLIKVAAVAHPAVSIERSDVRVELVKCVLLARYAIGRFLQDLLLSLHPLYRFVALIEAVIGDRQVVVEVEASRLSRDMFLHSGRPHLVVQRGVAVEASGGNPHDFWKPFGFRGEGIPIPDAGNRHAAERGQKQQYGKPHYRSLYREPCGHKRGNPAEPGSSNG